MSDIKLYLRTPISGPAAGDLLYLTKPDGSADGPATFTALAPVFGGVLAATFAPLSHTHAIADTTGLQAALDAKLAAADYTAADVLAKLLTVDGSGSGIDADLLDGNSAAAFALASHTHAISDTTGLQAALDAKLAAASYTAADVLTKLLTVDGSGSGLDADLLDGQSSAAFAAASHTHTASAITDFAEAVDDRVAALLVAGTNVTLTYNDAAGSLTIDATGGGGSSTIVQPQGRLTLTSNTPVLATDTTAQGTVYYTPYVGKYLPIYGGSSWSMLGFTQTSLALNSTDNLLGTLYDIFGYSNSGTLTLGTGPAWSNTATITVTIATPAVVTWATHGLVEGDPVVFTNAGGALPTGITAGTTYYVSSTSLAAGSFRISTTVANAAAGTNVATSGSQSGTHTGTNGTKLRGTGAGTTELELKDGIWTNKNAITLRAGGSSLGSISANQATYLGTIYCTANGQTGMAFKPAAASGGNNTFLGLWNAYNRVRVSAMSRESTASWTYNGATYRSLNASVSNRINFVCGLAQSPIIGGHAAFAGGGASGAIFGMSLDSTTGTPAGFGAVYTTNTCFVKDEWTAPLGHHFVQAQEYTGANYTIFGVQAYGAGQSLTVDLDM